MSKFAGIVLVVSGLAALSRPARAADPDVPPEQKIAIGAKAGLIPPVFSVVEVVVRPAPKLALGAFGLWLPAGVGPGNGGAKTALGGEVVYEFHDGRVHTPYLSGAYAYYHASTDANGNWETTQVAYLTAGYLWKWRSVELYFGGGLIIILSDETQPCTSICIDIGLPPALPTLELGVRFAFL